MGTFTTTNHDYLWGYVTDSFEKLVRAIRKLNYLARHPEPRRRKRLHNGRLPKLSRRRR